MRSGSFISVYNTAFEKFTLVPDKSKDLSVVRPLKCITFSSEAASQLLRSSSWRPVKWDKERAMLPSTKGL